MYLEDKKRKDEEAKAAKEPVIEVKDKFGRVMQKIVPG
jgi:hypothetical protein